MKVFVIYDSKCRKEVDSFRKEIADRYGDDTVLRMSKWDYSSNKQKPKKKGFHAWHRETVRLIKSADMIVYYVSNDSALNKNVEWEIKQIIKLGRFMVCLRKNDEYRLNDTISKSFNEKDKKNSLIILKKEEEVFSIIEDFNKDAYIKLFNDDKYDVNIMLEQYKMFTDSAESLVTRRLNMNSFYISSNTALITIGATVFALSDEQHMISKMIIILALSIPGMMLNISWGRILRAYFINNRGKMKILSMIEKRLSVSLYDAEWKAMKNRYSKEKYKSFTDSEKNLPNIFLVFYMLADVAAFIALMVLIV